MNKTVWFVVAAAAALLPGLRAEEKKWPEVPAQQLREDIFGLRLRVARELGGDKGGEKFLRTAFAKNPSTEAKAYLAWVCFYSQGWGMPSLKDPARGKELALAAIAEGSPLAMDVYGRALAHGLVPDARPPEAIVWLERAAQAGSPRALGRLGLLKVHGWNTPRDPAGGLLMATRAAELGAPDDLTDLAKLIENSPDGSEEDLTRALPVYALAARHDSQAAWERLRFLGEKHPRARVLVLTALVRAANDAVWMMPNKARSGVKELAEIAGDDPDAQVELGIAHLDGYFAKRDHARARELFQKAATLSNQDALFCLAKMRLRGFATPRDPAALDDIRQLAEAGNVRAAAYYAWVHYWGSSDVPGLDKDEAVTFRFVRIAAEKGDTWSLANLGFCYLHGIGTPKDNALAAKVYWQAYLRGYRDGLERTKRLLGFIPE